MGNDEDDDGIEGDESGRVQSYNRTIQCTVVEIYFVCELVDTVACDTCIFIYMHVASIL